MKTARAKASWLEEKGVRFDAAYHLSEGRQAQITIENHGDYESLADVTQRIFLGGRFRRTYVEDAERGYPYLTASDMIKSEPISGTYLSKIHTGKIDKLKIEKDWILVSCSGSIGRTVYTNGIFEGQIGTHDLIRIIPNPAKMPGGYVYAFLASKHGFSLLTQGTYGGVIQHIEPHHITGLPVPRLPAAQMQQIHEAVEQAAKLREDASKLLTEANEAFIAALHLEPGELQLLTSPNERDISASRFLKSSQVTSLTLRGRNYGLRLEKLIEVLSRGKWQPLEEMLAINPHHTERFKRLASTSNSAVEFYSQSDLFALKPKGQMISPKTIPFREKVAVRKGTILVAGVGTLGENEIFGRAKFGWGYLEDKLVAEHVLRFVPNEKVIDAGYLFTVLNSKLWFRILRSSVRGTSLLNFIIPLLNKMPIPRLGEAAEQEIGRNVKLAYEKLTEAIQLETQAIHEVESAISAWQK
jgi:hypothetical protein